MVSQSPSVGMFNFVFYYYSMSRSNTLFIFGQKILIAFLKILSMKLNVPIEEG